jgi:hypothetical protein
MPRPGQRTPDPGDRGRKHRAKTKKTAKLQCGRSPPPGHTPVSTRNRCLPGFGSSALPLPSSRRAEAETRAVQRVRWGGLAGCESALARPRPQTAGEEEQRTASGNAATSPTRVQLETQQRRGASATHSFDALSYPGITLSRNVIRAPAKRCTACAPTAAVPSCASAMGDRPTRATEQLLSAYRIRWIECTQRRAFEGSTGAPSTRRVRSRSRE